MQSMHVTTVSDVDRVEITEGWDEILTMDAVLNIADPFIVDDSDDSDDDDSDDDSDG